MTKVLTVRIGADLLVKAEARAARLGLDRAKYVRSLIEDDLAEAKAASPHKFASEDLAGLYEGTGSAATNVVIRQRLRNRSGAKTAVA
jgi:3-methyladenine DNA glycosylase AlkC